MSFEDETRKKEQWLKREADRELEMPSWLFWALTAWVAVLWIVCWTAE